MAKCIIYRIVGTKTTKDLSQLVEAHPLPCKYCAMRRQDLQVLYDEYMEWSQIEYEGAPVPSQLYAFMRLQPEEQARLVRIAQGYEEKDETKRSDRVPKGTTDIDGHPALGESPDDPRAGGQQRHGDDQGDASLWVSDGASGGVRAPGQQRRRT